MKFELTFTPQEGFYYICYKTEDNKLSLVSSSTFLLLNSFESNNRIFYLVSDSLLNHLYHFSVAIEGHNKEAYDISVDYNTITSSNIGNSDIASFIINDDNPPYYDNAIPLNIRVTSKNESEINSSLAIKISQYPTIPVEGGNGGGGGEIVCDGATNTISCITLDSNVGYYEIYINDMQTPYFTTENNLLLDLNHTNLKIKECEDGSGAASGDGSGGGSEDGSGGGSGGGQGCHILGAYYMDQTTEKNLTSSSNLWRYTSSAPITGIEINGRMFDVTMSGYSTWMEAVTETVRNNNELKSLISFSAYDLWGEIKYQIVNLTGKSMILGLYANPSDLMMFHNCWVFTST